MIIRDGMSLAIFLLTAFCVRRRRVSAARGEDRPAAHRSPEMSSRVRSSKNVGRAAIAAYDASEVARKRRCRVAPAEGGLVMETLSLDRLGDEIAELSAHLDAATARLLDLVREFDAREGWNTGFRS